MRKHSITLFGCILGLLLTVTPAFAQKPDASGQDWKKIAGEVMEQFKGKIVSIEKLDLQSCWAMLTPETKDDQAVQLAQDIGTFIKKKMNNAKDLKLMVRVFVNNKQVAIAVLEGDAYKGRLMSQPNLDPSVFKGFFNPK